MAKDSANNPFKENPFPNDPYKWAGEMGVESGPIPLKKWTHPAKSPEDLEKASKQPQVLQEGKDT